MGAPRAASEEGAAVFLLGVSSIACFPCAVFRNCQQFANMSKFVSWSKLLSNFVRQLWSLSLPPFFARRGGAEMRARCPPRQKLSAAPPLSSGWQCCFNTSVLRLAYSRGALSRLSVQPRGTCRFLASPLTG